MYICLFIPQTPEEEEMLNKKRSKKVQKKIDGRRKKSKISSLLEDQFLQGKLLGEFTTFFHESFEILLDIHNHLHFLKLINGKQLLFQQHTSAQIHSPKQIHITVRVLTNWFRNVTGCSHFYDHLRHVPLEQETQAISILCSLVLIWHLFIFHVVQNQWSRSKPNLCLISKRVTVLLSLLFNGLLPQPVLRPGPASAAEQTDTSWKGKSWSSTSGRSKPRKANRLKQYNQGSTVQAFKGENDYECEKLFGSPVWMIIS